MQVTVYVEYSDLEGNQGRHFTHSGDWVDHDTRDGELRITVRTAEGEVTGWRLYADGAWLSVQMTQPATVEVLRVRAGMAEQNRPVTPPNGGGSWGVGWGNSGPN